MYRFAKLWVGWGAAMKGGLEAEGKTLSSTPSLLMSTESESVSHSVVSDSL